MSSERELRGLAGYGQHRAALPLVEWLPLLAGFAAATGVAAILCPVPRPRTLTPLQALSMAAVYAQAIVIAGAGALTAVHAVTRGRSSAGFRAMVVRLCAATAWLPPLFVFYTRESMWAVCAAVLFAVTATRFIHRHWRDSEGPEPQPAFRPPFSLTVLAALCIQCAVVCALAGLARWSAVLSAVAVTLMAWFHKSASDDESTLPAILRKFPAAALAILFTAAGLTPYLAIAGGANDQQGSARWFWDALFPHPRTQELEAARNESHEFLKSMFGEGGDEGQPGPEMKNLRARAVSVVIGDSYTGMILRPHLTDRARIVPPQAKRRVFDQRPNERKADPLSIPFYGVYWFFRAPERKLPRDAAEAEGDPAETSFRTTDFSPIVMEARQNFGSLIDLNCCRAIQVVIHNADRRPHTVSLELILVNTLEPGQPTQSLGTAPVNSSLQWQADDDPRPPVAEVLDFAVPPQCAIRKFDEVIIRFVLSSPRRRWSAKIAIDRFRLMPHRL